MDISKLRPIEELNCKLKKIVGSEGIIQLAKDKLCPHFIFINPISKEETYWSIPSLLDDWLMNNYSQFIDGNLERKVQFFYFDKVGTCPDEDDIIPEELSKITDLYKLPVNSLVTPPGIYFLCKDRKIQYIGQAVNIGARVINHISADVKKFDSVFYILCPKSQLTKIERQLIETYRPPLNITWNRSDSNYLLGKEAEIESIMDEQI